MGSVDRNLCDKLFGLEKNFSNGQLWNNAPEALLLPSSPPAQNKRRIKKQPPISRAHKFGPNSRKVPMSERTFFHVCFKNGFCLGGIWGFQVFQYLAVFPIFQKFCGMHTPRRRPGTFTYHAKEQILANIGRLVSSWTKDYKSEFCIEIWWNECKQIWVQNLVRPQFGPVYKFGTMRGFAVCTMCNCIHSHCTVPSLYSTKLLNNCIVLLVHCFTMYWTSHQL